MARTQRTFLPAILTAALLLLLAGCAPAGAASIGSTTHPGLATTAPSPVETGQSASPADAPAAGAPTGQSSATPSPSATTPTRTALPSSASPTAAPAPTRTASPSSPPLAPQPAPVEPAPPACPTAAAGTIPAAPSTVSPGGVLGTTSDDLAAFARAYNAIRIANCLPPVPYGNIRYDACMEARLFWMAEDPSTDPSSAWGHIGSQRSDGVPSVGCDGNLAGGPGNTGATVAQKWWDSTGHRASLYKPTYTGSTAGVCVLFAMTHGGIPNEPASFTRAAARWVTC